MGGYAVIESSKQSFTNPYSEVADLFKYLQKMVKSFTDDQAAFAFCIDSLKAMISHLTANSSKENALDFLKCQLFLQLIVDRIESIYKSDKTDKSIKIILLTITLDTKAKQFEKLANEYAQNLITKTDKGSFIKDKLSFDAIVTKITGEISKHSKRSYEEIKEFVESSVRFYINASASNLISKDYIIMVNADWSRSENRYFAIDVKKMVNGDKDFLEYAEECALGKNISTSKGCTPQGGAMFDDRHEGPRWRYGGYDLIGLEDRKKNGDDPRKGASNFFINNTDIENRGIIMHPYSTNKTQKRTNGCIAVGGEITIYEGETEDVKRRTSDILEHIGKYHRGAGVYVYTQDYSGKFDYTPADGFSSKIAIITEQVSK